MPVIVYFEILVDETYSCTKSLDLGIRFWRSNSQYWTEWSPASVILHVPQIFFLSQPNNLASNQIFLCWRVIQIQTDRYITKFLPTCVFLREIVIDIVNCRIWTKFDIKRRILLRSIKFRVFFSKYYPFKNIIQELVVWYYISEKILIQIQISLDLIVKAVDFL